LSEWIDLGDGILVGLGNVVNGCTIWDGHDLRMLEPGDNQFIRAMIHYEIDVALFGVAEAQRNLVAHDPQAQFALQQFGEAVKLTELAKTRPSSRGGH